MYPLMQLHESPTYVDLISHLNYRYVGLTIGLIFSFIFRNFIRYLILGYFLIADGYFLYKTLKRY